MFMVDQTLSAVWLATQRVYKYVSMTVYIYIYTHMYMYIYIYTPMYLYIYMYKYIYIYTHMCFAYPLKTSFTVAGGLASSKPAATLCQQLAGQTK